MTITNLQKLILIVCLFVFGCASPEGGGGGDNNIVGLPTRSLDSATWDLWQRIEVGINSGVAAIPGESSVSIEGVSAGFEIGSSEVSLFSVTVVSSTLTPDVINTVKEAVLHAMIEEEIPCASIVIKKYGESPVERIIDVVNPINR